MSKPYFFSNSQQLRHDINRDAADPSYRLSVGGYWTGLPAVGVDAAINWGNGFVYFFAGSQYNRSKMSGQTVAQHRFGQRQRSGSVFDCVRPDEIWPQARPTEPREFSKASSTERSTLITHETRPPHASRFRVLPNTTFL